MSGLKRRGFLITGLVMALFFWSSTVTFAQGSGTVAGISIACSNDYVYTWYANRNRTVTVGTSENLGARSPARSYSLPLGMTPAEIIGIGIAGNDHVYAWYRDGTVSSGTSDDLDKYRARYSYSLAPGKTPRDVVGIDIACSNDRVYVWYQDGTVSSGTSDDLDKYRAPYSYSLAPGKAPANVVEIGIAKNDHVYAWYWDRTVSSGTSADLDKHRPLYNYVWGLDVCELQANAPEINQGFIVGVGSRGPNCRTSAEITVSLKVPVTFGGAVVIDKKTATVTNADILAKKVCISNSDLVVYVEVEGEGRKVRSKAVRIQGCQVL